MDSRTPKLEALKLLKEWSVWMVAVQTVAIGYLKSAEGPPGLLRLAAITFFSLSILAAASLLGGIPAVAEEVDRVEKSIYDHPLRIGSLPIWTLRLLTAVQHLATLLGLTLLVAAMWVRQ